MKRSRDNILAMEARTPGVAVIHDNLPEIQNGRAPVGIVYQKGGWVLHVLRGVIGTDKFWAGIREYYRRFRDSNASTEDLRHVMEEASGRDLRWFFQQWLVRAGSPAVEWWWRYNRETKKVEVTITQTQAGEAYRLPMDVSVGGNIQRVELTDKSQKFELPAEKAPGVVELDPGMWVLMTEKSRSSG
jgi:aminopeptidase N